MNTDWPSRDQDLQDAKYIISRYQEDNDVDGVPVVDVLVNQSNKKITLRAPEWMVEVAEFFDEKYGSEMGREITKKVITRCLLSNATIH